jgi:hypothetical protein
VSSGPNSHHDYESNYENPGKKFGSPDDLEDGYPWLNKDGVVYGGSAVCCRCLMDAVRPRDFKGVVKGEEVEGPLCTDCFIVLHQDPVEFEEKWGGVEGEVGA